MKIQGPFFKKQEKGFLLSLMVLLSTCYGEAFYLLFSAILLKGRDAHRMGTGPHKHRRPHSVTKACRTHVGLRPPPVWKVAAVSNRVGNGADASESLEAAENLSCRSQEAVGNRETVGGRITCEPSLQVPETFSTVPSLQPRIQC